MTLASTVPFYNISTLCNRNKTKNSLKLKEPHAKICRAAVWPPLHYNLTTPIWTSNKANVIQLCT